MPLTPGTQVGRYRVIRLIAQGGMAEVYRAEQELTAGIYRPAALKVIRPEYAESPDFREMFLDEARTACTLSHPHIVHIYEVGDSDGRLFMAMELVPGETVATVARRLRERGERFADEGLLAVGVYTCSALEAVHALRLAGEGHVNLVHRDVSPHNLLLGPTGSLKLIDFGIAKAVHNRNLTSPGVTKGKAGYFSPEQAMGKALDGRSDLFSLGVMLYKLAYGATPFDEHRDHHARNTALVHGRWLPLRQVCAGLPASFYDVVDRALQVRPEDRWADARSMREALERVALDCGVQLGPSSLAYYVPEQDDSADYTGSGRRLSSTPQPPRPVPSTALQPLTGQLPSGRKEAGQVKRGDGEGTSTVAEGATVLETSLQLGADSLPPVRKETVQIRASRPDPTVGSPKLRRRWRVIAAAAAFVLAVGGGLMLADGLWRDENPPVPPAHVNAPTVDAPTPSAEPEVEFEPPSVAPVQGRPGSLRAESGEGRTPEASALAKERPVVAKNHASASESGPRGEVKPVKSSGRGSPSPSPASAAPPPPSPGGEGLLRVGADLEAKVRIPGQPWEATPLNRKVPSGRYKVELRSTSGQRGSCEVDVLPDRRVILRYDFKTGSCSNSQY